MTDLDEYWPPAEPREVVPTPRRHRHVWVVHRAGDELFEYRCKLCSALRDDIASRRGKNNRNRGNGFEREVAAKLGGHRVGMYGDKVDVEVPGWLRVQTKNGAAYPALLDRWLRAIPFQADLLRAVVIGDAPGPGHPRRSLIVLDLEEFASWYGKR
jgi:hypothetical protein